MVYDRDFVTMAVVPRVALATTLGSSISCVLVSEDFVTMAWGSQVAWAKAVTLC